MSAATAAAAAAAAGAPAAVSPKWNNVHLRELPVRRAPSADTAAKTQSQKQAKKPTDDADADADAADADNSSAAGDPELAWTRVKATTPGVCYSLASPSPFRAPRLAAESAQVLRGIGLPADADADDEDTASASSPTKKGRRALLAGVVAGNVLLDGMEPSAHTYCGHQFGNFAGQLGDGRAVTLGVVDAAAPDLFTWEEVQQGQGQQAEQVQDSKIADVWELALKGAGPTPYSRGSDGRAVVRSSVREYLCSEHMHALGIATTRAAALVVSGGSSPTIVVRDPFYDGRARHERCAVVLRVARSFVRFGSFQLALGEDPMTGASGPSAGDVAPVRALTAYVKKHFYPGGTGTDAELLGRVAQRTAWMVACWQAVGFCHGVLNTDNLSILGVTIDYGPFGFMEYFDRNHVCNTSDNSGRYTYARQPEMVRWDLGKLAECLDLTTAAEGEGEAAPMIAHRVLQRHYDDEYDAAYAAVFRWKLGLLTDEERTALAKAEGAHSDTGNANGISLTTVAAGLCGERRPGHSEATAAAAAAAAAAGSSSSDSDSDDDDDEREPSSPAGKAAALVKSLLDTMEATGSDFTLSFRSLARVPAFGFPEDAKGAQARKLLATELVARACCPVSHLEATRKPGVPRDRLEALLQVASQVDPREFEMRVGVPPSWLREQLARHDAFDRLPQDEDAKVASDTAKWEAWLGAYSAALREWHAGKDEADVAAPRQTAMLRVANPARVLRNYVAQEAIDAVDAANGPDGSDARIREGMNRVEKLVTHPFDDAESTDLDLPRPEGCNLAVSCSS